MSKSTFVTEIKGKPIAAQQATYAEKDAYGDDIHAALANKADKSEIPDPDSLAGDGLDANSGKLVVEIPVPDPNGKTGKVLSVKKVDDVDTVAWEDAKPLVDGSSIHYNGQDKLEVHTGAGMQIGSGALMTKITDKGGLAYDSIDAMYVVTDKGIKNNSGGIGIDFTGASENKVLAAHDTGDTDSQNNPIYTVAWNPGIPPVGTNQHRGDILTVDDTDKVVWDTAPTVPQISNYNGEFSNIRTENSVSSGGYVFNVNLDSNTMDEVIDQSGQTQVKRIAVKNPVPPTTSASNGDVLTVDSNGGIGWAPVSGGGGGGGGNPYTKVSVTPSDCYINGKTSDYGFDLYDQDVTISNNTYSILSGTIGYYPAQEDGDDYIPAHNLDNLVIKLPDDTAFPMAVVEFTVKDDDDYYYQGCVNNVKVKVGNTDLTRMYSAPYNPNTLLLGGSYHDQFEYWKLVTEPNAGNPYYRIEQIHNQYRGADITAFVHGTKVQVQIFGSCYNITMSQACGEPSAS